MQQWNFINVYSGKWQFSCVYGGNFYFENNVYSNKSAIVFNLAFKTNWCENYASFYQAIVNKMPAKQQPNLFDIGKENQAFFEKLLSTIFGLCQLCQFSSIFVTSFLLTIFRWLVDGVCQSGFRSTLN